MNYSASKSKIVALLIGLLTWSQAMFVFSADGTQTLKKIVIAIAPSRLARLPHGWLTKADSFANTVWTRN